MSGSPWTTLEVTKVAVSALTPLTVLGLGALVARSTRHVDDLRWANQQVVGRRLDLYSEIGPIINQLFCFATFVGRWKELDAQQVLAAKRKVDEIMYANRPIFSSALFQVYERYMATLFLMYATVDGSALLRVPTASEWGDRRNLPWWRPEMTDLFSADAGSTLEQIREAHELLQQAFRGDLYVVATSSQAL